MSWKHKWLWIFGFFATFLGNSTFYEAIVRSYGNMAAGESLYDTMCGYANSGIFSTFTWDRISQLWQSDTAAFGLSAFVLFAMLLVAAFVIIMAIVSQIGLVRSAVLLDEKKKITYREAFRVGIFKFWPVFFLNLITRAFMFGIVVLLAYLVSLFLSNQVWADFLLYIVSFLLLLICGIIIYFMTIYATAFMVLREKKFWTAIRYAWYIFKQNVLLNIEMGLMMFLINVIVGVVAVIIAIFAVSPFIVLYVLLLMLGITSASWLLMVLVAVLILTVLVFTGSWYTSFHVSVWSLLFEELAMKRGEAKLLRLIKHVTGGKKKKKTVAKKK